jgi:hypothetical protein
LVLGEAFDFVGELFVADLEVGEFFYEFALFLFVFLVSAFGELGEFVQLLLFELQFVEGPLQVVVPACESALG